MWVDGARFFGVTVHGDVPYMPFYGTLGWKVIFGFGAGRERGELKQGGGVESGCVGESGGLCLHGPGHVGTVVCESG